jgi:Uma2 family endonuclease
MVAKMKHVGRRISDWVPLAETQQAAREIGRITYAQFLRWNGENQHVEWADGKIVPLPPVDNEHCEVLGFCLVLLGAWIDHHDLGTLRTAPFQMKTGPRLPGRCPDLFFVHKSRRHRFRRMYFDGPADLAVEVISSEGDPEVDRTEKFREYERGGVREYWLLDPTREIAHFYRLGRDGRYRPLRVDANGIVRSEVLSGLWLKPEWLCSRSQPDITSVLRQWKLL